MRTNEGISVEEVRSCLICGSDGVLLYENLRDRHFNAPGIWTLLQCPDCRLVWLNPRPIPTDIGKLYREYYTHNDASNASHFSGLKIAIQNVILEVHMGYKNLNSSLLVKELGRIFSLIKPIRERVELSVMSLKGHNTGKLLDVGCGSGQFLTKMRDLGWEVSGVDPDEQSIELAKKRFNLDVKKGTVEQVQFPDDTFDAITMNHVVEHLLDPIGSLMECRRILRKTGKLVILTPNIKSLGLREFGQAWLHLDPPRHLYLFSPDSLRVCAKRANLNIQVLKTTARTAHGIWGISYLIQQKGILPNCLQKDYGILLKLEGLAFWVVENVFCWAANVGEEVILVATK